MASRRAVLGIDVGTSSCRASLYDLSGRRLPGVRGQVAYAVTTTADGGAELDPDLLSAAVCEALDKVAVDPGHTIVGVAASVFWHSLIGLDAQGSPLTPVFLWLDARSRAAAAALRGQLDQRRVHARTGCVLHWSYWPAKLAWLRRTRPEIVDRVARWVSFGELLLERLAGQPGVSVSMASGTGLLDQHTCDWDAELLDIVHLGPDRLSPIVSLDRTGTLRPTFQSRWPALRGVPWLKAVGDGACSNLGAGCSTPERFAVMIGTSGAERVVWRPPAAFEIPWGTWGYRVDAQRLVLGGALNDGGSLFAWLRRAFRLPSLHQAEADVSAMAPDSHGLTVLPFWAGERSPGWADDARGAIIGLRLHTTPVEILRAALEAVALRFGEIDRLLLRAMPSGREVVATGGALLRSPAWLQIMADVLGRPVLASTEPEASSRGASLLALERLGFLARPLETLLPVARRTYQPDPTATERYRAAAERQRHLYDVLIGESG